MFAFPISHRLADRVSARPPRVRRPIVEDLEGRRLPSGIVGNHIGTSVATVVIRKAGGKDVTPAIAGNHIGMNPAPAIVGNHIGMSVAPAIVGNHIGTNVA